VRDERISLLLQAKVTAVDVGGVDRVMEQTLGVEEQARRRLQLDESREAIKV
jgi:hypothetical protein